jgi:hypothetical protein
MTPHASLTHHQASMMGFRGLATWRRDNLCAQASMAGDCLKVDNHREEQ